MLDQKPSTSRPFALVALHALKENRTQAITATLSIRVAIPAAWTMKARLGLNGIMMSWYTVKQWL